MTIRIREFRQSDFELGMRLKTQAGWNQLEQDWKRTYELEPDGCFVASSNEIDAGTVATTRFGDVGWISLMLVDQAFRRQGIGREPMWRAIEYLEAQGCVSIRLDATPLGHPLYESLGFRLDYELVRYSGISVMRATSADQGPTSSFAHGAGIDGAGIKAVVRPLSQDCWKDVCNLDHLVAGVDRSRFLQRLWDEQSKPPIVFVRQSPAPSNQVECTGKLQAYCFVRAGCNGTLVGPCCGNTSAAGLLLELVLDRHASRSVIADVPTGNLEANHIVKSFGLMPQRTLSRMTRGRPTTERRELIWTSSGPEKG